MTDDDRVTAASESDELSGLPVRNKAFLTPDQQVQLFKGRGLTFN